MDRINAMLDRINELSADELNELRDAIVTEFDTVQKQDLTREVADQMTALGTAATAVRDEEGRRVAEVSDLEQAAATAAALVNGDTASGDATGEDAAEEAAVKEPEEEEVISEVVEEAPVETPEEEEDPEEAARKKKALEDAASASVSETPEAVASTEEVDTAATTEVSATAELSTAEEPEAVVSEEEKTDEAPEAESTVVEEEAVVVENVDSLPEAEEVENESEEKDSEETVTAAANTDGLSIEVPEDRRVDAKETNLKPVTITAGADIQGFPIGSELPNLRAVAQALLERKKAMGRTTGGDGEQLTIASFNTTFPDERTLVSGDFDGNSKKISSVVSEEAIVAAGGLCAPVEVSYDIFGLGELGRPVRDSLANFSADRGGIRFVTPPVLSDLNGAVSLWTLQDDIDAATAGAPDPVKPCIRVACGQEVTVYTDAIPLCLTFGNLGARAWPELVERHTQLGLISHARYAETRLLTRIGTLSTAVSTAKQLGAARDIFVAVEQAAAGYRSRHRMNSDAKLRAIFPLWFKNALRADLTKQLPGDGDDTTFALADARINAWFAIRGIEVTWHMDGESTQIFGSQAAGALNAFPTNVIWYLFSEGTFLFLDGGTLDLGLVRDSTLNGTNDYKIFLETFEGVAKVGIESLRVSTQLAIAGASAATANTLA